MDEKTIKKRHMKMIDTVFKYNSGDITFPELINRLTKIEEFYRDG